MKDPLTPKQRGVQMGRVRAKDTGPEMIVRRLVHSKGYRYRLHSRELPGSPDLVFKSRRKVIFVHGCFWHRHSEECPLTRMPKSRQDFWAAKFEENVTRDAVVGKRLLENGWQYLIVWECETKKSLREELTAKIVAFLDT